MPESGFSVLRRSLYERGVDAGYAERLLAELREHRVDLESEQLAAGDSHTEAALRARRRLGSDAAIVAQVLARPELRGRWSSIRAALRPLKPFGAVNDHWFGDVAAPPAITRWTASVSLGSLMTVVMLFALAQSITTGV